MKNPQVYCGCLCSLRLGRKRKTASQLSTHWFREKNNEKKQTIRVAHDPAIPLRISGVTRSNEYRFEQIQF